LNNNKINVTVDNHQSHCSAEAILAKENDIILLITPPHTSHELQPLNWPVFRSYKTYYNIYFKDWMNTCPGTPITEHEVAEICGKAYPLALNPVNVQV
jgi:hypothetical protein